MPPVVVCGVKTLTGANVSAILWLCGHTVDSHDKTVNYLTVGVLCPDTETVDAPYLCQSFDRPVGIWYTGNRMFDTELNYFIAHQDELVSKYQGKTLVIRGERVEGAYDSALSAYIEGQKQFALGSFMIQPCEAGPSAYTVRRD